MIKITRFAKYFCALLLLCSLQGIYALYFYFFILKKLSTILEVCSFSLDWCLAAERAGAQRVELCTGIYEGGTTPSYGLIQQVKLKTTIELAVIIRPRAGDFCYNTNEIETMKADITACKSMGVDAVVIGVLTPEGTVNKAVMKELISLAQPMNVVFHRAIDRCVDYLTALEDIMELGCHRVLTSGHQQNVGLGLNNLKKLVKQANGRIEIMAGGGLNNQNLADVLATGVDAVHLSGRKLEKSLIQNMNPAVIFNEFDSMPEDSLWVCNEDKVLEIRKLIEKSY